MVIRLRVIAGEHKGRKLDTVANKLTRPTSDKVKEALFNRIGPFFDGGIALDLFAGSGGLGIEALSRGVDQVIFVDQQLQAIQKVKENLTRLHLDERAEVYRNDAFRALKVLAKRELMFDYVFLDPPYKKDFYEPILEALFNYNLTHDDTLLVLEHDRFIVLPETIHGFKQLRSEKYGGITMISLYQKEGTNHD